MGSITKSNINNPEKTKISEAILRKGMRKLKPYSPTSFNVFRIKLPEFRFK